MIIFTSFFRKSLIGTVLLSTLALSCSNRLKDYTQLTMNISTPEGVGELEDERLEAAETILEKRLSELGIENAEIETEILETDSDSASTSQLIVRLPLEANADAAVAILTNTGQLTLRNQKPDTEDALAENIEALQRLLVQQETLVQTGEQEKADALQPQVVESRQKIFELFEPSELTGDRVTDARAREIEGGGWGVNIQFDERGTQMFAEQTKLMAGTGRAVGLFLDDVLLSAPVVNVEYADNGILGGVAVISGNFTQEAARDLEVQLKSGALPVMLEVVEVTSTADAEGADDSTPKEDATAPSADENAASEEAETKEPSADAEK